MEEQQLDHFALTHLLQHTLRLLCTHEDSQWVYAIFWRILPRNYPPPKWDLPGPGAYDRSRGNRRNWILVWEDGFCNFAASTRNYNSHNEHHHHMKGLQPELFFKMSHEIYNYGEGLIGKIAADHSHKWVFKEPPKDDEVSPLSAWQNQADSHPRTWEAQFQSGIETIALIAVREGVVQLGAVNKVMEDLSYVVLLRTRFSYLESIPGVLLPHPSSSSPAAATFPLKADGRCTSPENFSAATAGGKYKQTTTAAVFAPPQPAEFYNHNFIQQMQIAPSMSSLDAFLSMLPSVGANTPVPPSAIASAAVSPATGFYEATPPPLFLLPPQIPVDEAMGIMVVAKEEIDGGVDERSKASSMCGN